MADTIIITEGDPAGISYEILDKSFSILKKTASKKRVILVSSQNQIQSKFSSQFKPLSDLTGSKTGLYHYYKPVFSTRELSKIKPGRPSEITGKSSYESLLSGISLQKETGADLITLPLSKEWVIRSGIVDFTGHTEALAEEYAKKTFMLMYGRSLNVIPLTTHVPLVRVPHYLSKLNISALANAIKNTSLFSKPRIAVCGLNPHAGEHGKIGNEESEILLPFIGEMKKNRLKVEGPISADSLFIPEISKNYDLIFSCYHDQGLIPFKSMIGKYGVNVTLGLDFIRVSPDHGPAFDIAGKGKGDPESLIQCIKLLN